MAGKILEIYTDGACSGNPGPAAAAFVIQENGKAIQETARFLGKATNNIAEYTALIDALKAAQKLKPAEVTVRTDSELMFNQLKGDYQVRNANIKPLFEEVQRLAAGFKKVSMEWIPREKNSVADGLARQAIQREQAKTVASKFTFGEESPSSTG